MVYRAWGIGQAGSVGGVGGVGGVGRNLSPTLPHLPSPQSPVTNPQYPVPNFVFKVTIYTHCNWMMNIFQEKYPVVATWR
ncbi:hypothetical protein CV014_25735 [Nostoc sp. CMAA1605]|nr:hypothetical protein [Nostoc sp. CMAA1605]